MKAGLQAFRLSLALGYCVAAILVSLAGLAAIGYFAWTGEWAPAIFALLARKELVGWLDRRTKDIAPSEQGPLSEVSL